jgi:hypothetical protein
MPMRFMSASSEGQHSRKHGVCLAQPTDPGQSIRRKASRAISPAEHTPITTSQNRVWPVRCGRSVLSSPALVRDGTM